MFDFALENDLEIVGPIYTVYLLDTASVADREQFLLQAAVQVKRRAI
jgi:effector-binding domain-containing protein